MAATKESFFDDEPESGPVPEVETAEPSRGRSRRRPKQPVVSFPSFDEELKEGTSLHNLKKAVTLEEIGHTYRKSPDVIKGPRKIGSQFLDLDRGFTVNLAGVDEEITALSAQDLRKLAENLKNPGHSDLQGQLSDRIYVERNGKFYALSKRSERKLENEKTSDISAKITPADIHRSLRKISLCSHGLLAGYALLHCIFSWTLFPPRVNLTSFFEFGISLNPILSTIYRFLIAISCFSCLCRIDLAGGYRSANWFSFIPSIIATILYFAAAVITHLCDSIMTIAFLEFRNSTAGHPDDLKSEIRTWIYLDTARLVSIGVGWILLSFCWKKDCLMIRLKSDGE